MITWKFVLLKESGLGSVTHAVLQHIQTSQIISQQELHYILSISTMVLLNTSDSLLNAPLRDFTGA